MMNRKMKQRTLPGVPYAEERSYESRNRQIARGAAAEGMVLLKMIIIFCHCQRVRRLPCMVREPPIH